MIKKPTVLKLAQHDEDKEIDFELAYLVSLSTQQRFQMMYRKSAEMRKLAQTHANRNITQIIKRT